MLVCVPPSRTCPFLLINTKKRSTWVFWLGAIFSQLPHRQCRGAGGIKEQGLQAVMLFEHLEWEWFCVCVSMCTRVWCVWYELIQDGLLFLMKCLSSSLLCVWVRSSSWHGTEFLSVPYVVESSHCLIHPSKFSPHRWHLHLCICWEGCLVPLNCLWPFELCVTVVWTYRGMCLWVFYFVTVTYAFCYCNCILSPEITVLSTLVLFFKMTLAVFRFLIFPYFRIAFFISTKRSCWNFYHKCVKPIY